MRKSVRSICASVLGLALASGCLRAQFHDLKQRLCDKADAIVVGKIEDGSLNASRAVFSLRIERVLKGDGLDGAVLPLEWRMCTPMRGVVSLGGKRGLWFLAREGAANWGVITAAPGQPLFQGAYFPLPAEPGAATFDAALATSVHDQVAAELAEAAIRANNENFLFLSAEALLRAENSPFVADLFRKLSLSESVDARALALARGLSLNDADAAVRLASELDSILTSRYRTEISLNVFSWRSAESRAIRALGKIATNEADIGPLKYSAAAALQAVHTKEAVPFLAALLDSPDRSMREQAIRGLSLFVENVPVVTAEGSVKMVWLAPGPSTQYRDADTDRFSGTMRVPPEREAEFVAFWKNWWDRKKAEIEKGP